MVPLERLSDTESVVRSCPKPPSYFLFPLAPHTTSCQLHMKISFWTDAAFRRCLSSFEGWILQSAISVQKKNLQGSETSYFLTMPPKQQQMGTAPVSGKIPSKLRASKSGLGRRKCKTRVPGRTGRRSRWCGFAEVLGLYRAELSGMNIGIRECKMTARWCLTSPLNHIPPNSLSKG